MQTAVGALNKDDQIVITGAGGFIAGSLARYFHDRGFTRIRAIDKKPLPLWYQRVPGVECLSNECMVCWEYVLPPQKGCRAEKAPIYKAFETC